MFIKGIFNFNLSGKYISNLANIEAFIFFEIFYSIFLSVFFSGYTLPFSIVLVSANISKIGKGKKERGKNVKGKSKREKMSSKREKGMKKEQNCMKSDEIGWRDQNPGRLCTVYTCPVLI